MTLGTNLAEFLEGDFTISIFVREDDCLVHDLLQLCVLEVRAYHHLENLEELSIGYVTIFVHIVDSKRN